MIKKKDDNKIAQSFSMFGDNNVQFKKYESLMPKNEYDHDKAETLAEAMTELVTINKRKKYLESLLHENKDLKPYLWSSMDGRVQAFHKIEDSHFTNILQFLASKGRSISKQLRAEAASRGIDVPEAYTAADEYFDALEYKVDLKGTYDRSVIEKLYNGDWSKCRYDK